MIYAHPWNESLVEASNATSTPYSLECLEHCLCTVGSHLGLDHFEWLS